MLELVTEKSTDGDDSSEVRPTYSQDFHFQALAFGSTTNVGE